MTLVLDAGALIALERNDRAMWVRLKDAVVNGDVPCTHGGVVGQVWRGGARQFRLGSALKGIDIRPLDAKLGRAAGRLLGAANKIDVIDAAIVLLAVDGDVIATSDVADLHALAVAGGRHIELVDT